MMRLDRLIAEQLCITRSEASRAIADGIVTVNGKRCRPADKVDEEKDIIVYAGQQVVYRKYIYLMLNKPQGVICATKDRVSDTVMSLIPPELRRKDLFPAGRLDKDTTGFVFITNDGALAHDMLSPRHHTEKEYVVDLRDAVTDRERYEDIIAGGMTIDGGEVCLPAQIVFTEDPCIVHIILCEGKYHQVKRMFHALGNEVISLRRIRIGGVCLGEDLPEGACRELSEKEVKTICTKGL